MTLPLRLYQVDAFVSDKPFSGNPAGVCLLTAPKDERWMQNVAREMNLSETAFLLKRTDGYELRWFTPTVEVELCGHATLAGAHVLWEAGELERGRQARFHTKSGLLTADRNGDLIELDFPATADQPADTPHALPLALGVKPGYVGRSKFDYVVEIDSEDVLRAMKPDFEKLREISARGIIVTCRSARYDFVSRFFGPAAGVDEDPVTGSAHCCLGPFWQTRLQKNRFVAYQASARGGIVHVRVEDDRVKLGGRAATIFRGELL